METAVEVEARRFTTADKQMVLRGQHPGYPRLIALKKRLDMLKTQLYGCTCLRRQLSEMHGRSRNGHLYQIPTERKLKLTRFELYQEKLRILGPKATGLYPPKEARDGKSRSSLFD